MSDCNECDDHGACASGCIKGAALQARRELREAAEAFDRIMARDNAKRSAGIVQVLPLAPQPETVTTTTPVTGTHYTVPGPWAPEMSSSEKLESDPAMHLASQRNLIALKCGPETAWIVDQAIAALRDARSATGEREVERFEDWAGPAGFCLDQIFMSTDGVPDNPFLDKDTKLAYRIWLAATDNRRKE